MARTMLRDKKGRFVSSKNENNLKENNIMNNKENRKEALRNAGYNVDNFFDLNLRVPFGATVTINVDGKEMVLGQDNTNEYCVNYDENGIPVIPVSATSNLTNDPIAKEILDNGYVFNSRTDGRFVTAQTFRMLNTISYSYKTKKYASGWDAYLRNNYGFMYQFEMLADELHKLAKMERSNDTEFARLSSFFTKEVVYETCSHYIRQLKKFIRKQPNRKCKGVPYVKLNKYGDVFIKDLETRVYRKMELALFNIKNTKNYTELEKEFNKFSKLMVKLPYDTPKSSVWKDAFKGKGAYVTLLNIIKFHGVTVQNYETKKLLNTYESVAYVESLLNTYKNEYWRFHELLKATIKLNQFDLGKSIEAQKN